MVHRFVTPVLYVSQTIPLASCLIIRPLPEEEELEDELFAGTSEEGAPGNETNYDMLDYCSVLRRIFKGLFTFSRSVLIYTCPHSGHE